MSTRLDENNTCTVQGNGGGELCPHASTRIAPVQYKETGGGGAMPTRLDGNNTCTVQGTGGGELCPHASTRKTPVQYKKMGGGGSYAHTPR